MTTRLFAFGFLLSLSLAKAQPTFRPQVIDRLFSEWQRPDVPGVAITIVQNGRLLYSQGYGMAHIQRGQAIRPNIRFWIASVTKQFTAAGIYRLEAQRKISVDHSIRRYLPGLPAIYQAITLDQLLHHTSGIRDGFVLTALAGKPEADYTNQNVFQYLCQQQQLNFAPGTEYEYNNSGYVLLAMVIEQVTHQSYATFLQKQLFKPLGMHDTEVVGHYRIGERMAEGYRQEDGMHKETHFQGNTYGSTGIITTVDDLARWTAALQQPDSVLSDIKAKLLTPGTLLDGRKIAYAGGLEKFVYRGKPVYEHAGADAGFQANLVYFPQSGLSIIGVTNNSSNYALTRNLYAIADEWHHEGKPTIAPSADESQPLQSAFYYHKETQPLLRQVISQATHLTIQDTPDGYAAPYYPMTPDTFQSSDPVPVYYALDPGRALTLIDSSYHQGKRFSALVPVRRTDDFESFTGTYYAPELQTSFQVVEKADQLWLQFTPEVQFPLFRLTSTDFMFSYAGGNYLEFSPTGFMFSREGCRRLRFTKQ